MDLNNLRDEIYEDAVAHGLWEDADEFSKRYADGYPAQEKEMRIAHSQRCLGTGLVFDEVEELCESAEDCDVDGVQEELADVIIMSLSVAGKLDIDIDAAVRRKMEINKGRAWKHGKE